MPWKDPEKRKKYEKERSQRPEYKKRQREYNKIYNARPEVKERTKKRQKIYNKRPEVKQRTKKRQKKYIKKPEVKTRRNLRAKVRSAVIHQTAYISTIHKLIGCDVPTARAHLEAQFEDWMNWNNYGRGKGKWCIDHIIAVATIDIFNEEEVQRIFHYTNMQPLEFLRNCEKGISIEEGVN